MTMLLFETSKECDSIELVLLSGHSHVPLTVMVTVVESWLTEDLVWARHAVKILDLRKLKIWTTWKRLIEKTL